jgi:putative aldouronate transport system substrate-binding protein
MKPLLISIFTFIICLSLSACGNPNGNADTDSAEPLVWLSIGWEPHDFNEGMVLINEYIYDRLGFTVDLRIVDYDLFPTVLYQMIDENTIPDIAFADWKIYNGLVNDGLLADITDDIQRYAPELWDFTPEILWNGARVSGKIYAVPTYKDSSLTEYWVFDAYYLEKYDMDIAKINTYDDLETVLEIWKNGEGEDFYPLSEIQISSNIFGYDSFCSGMNFIGVKMDDGTRTVINLLEQPEFIEFLKTLRRWHENGLIGEIDKESGVPFLTSVAWPGAEYVWQRAYGVERYISKPVFGPVIASESIQGSMNVILSNSDRKDDALRFLELINTDRTLRDMFAYGIEGRNFEYVGEKVVRILNHDWQVEVHPQATFFNMSATVDLPEQWEMLKKINESAKPSVLLGFMMNVSEIKVERKRLLEVWSKYEVSFSQGLSVNGVSIEEDIIACIEELRENGLDTVMNEAQKQINAHFEGE